MYNAVGKEYGFDHGEKDDFGEAKKHLEVKAFKLKEAEKSLKKLETEIIKKELELAERARDIEPEKQINLFNAKNVIKQHIQESSLYKMDYCKSLEYERNAS